MKLGILAFSMSRRAGGLYWAVRSLAGSVREAGCNVQVFAGQDEFSERDRAGWGDIPLAVFPTRGPLAIGYQVGLSNALTTAGLDLAHVHGLWNYPSVAARRWGRKGKPYLISPHGMLDPWAVQNSYWKKRLAGVLYENAHLREAACIHALCEQEYAAVRSYGLTNPVAVIPNGVETPDLNAPIMAPDWATDFPPESKILFFLSRIHPKKGLVNLLQAWAQVKGVVQSAAEPWHLVLAGWEQGGHQAELERLARDLGVEAGVHFVGPQFDTAKAASFRRADAFILPSFSEGLPMAVLEAWSYGLPVLMTPQCNISEGFDAGAAIKVEPNPEDIARGLRQFFELTDAQKSTMGEKGAALVAERFTWPRVASEMLTVYEWVLGQGPRPDCVRLD